MLDIQVKGISITGFPEPQNPETRVATNDEKLLSLS
jgi:hypothetical protein